MKKNLLDKLVEFCTQERIERMAKCNEEPKYLILDRKTFENLNSELDDMLNYGLSIKNVVMAQEVMGYKIAVINSPETIIELR